MEFIVILAAKAVEIWPAWPAFKSCDRLAAVSLTSTEAMVIKGSVTALISAKRLIGALVSLTVLPWNNTASFATSLRKSEAETAITLPSVAVT